MAVARTVRVTPDRSTTRWAHQSDDVNPGTDRPDGGRIPDRPPHGGAVYQHRPTGVLLPRCWHCQHRVGQTPTDHTRTHATTSTITSWREPWLYGELLADTHRLNVCVCVCQDVLCVSVNNNTHTRRLYSHDVSLG